MTGALRGPVGARGRARAGVSAAAVLAGVVLLTAGCGASGGGTGLPRGPVAHAQGGSGSGSGGSGTPTPGSSYAIPAPSVPSAPVSRTPSFPPSRPIATTPGTWAPRPTSAGTPTRPKGPDLSRTPSASPKSLAATGPSPSPGRAVIRIGNWASYVARGGQDEVDACKDAVQWSGPEIGKEDGYELQTAVIVGHDYCNGFDQFAKLPVGTRVTLTTVRGTWTYEVYANYITPGRGAPAAGLYWGDLTLQSCVGPDTGFSYLTRV
ncbi:hypothetical protein SSP24_70880 [Streptomyces spinoverrucosus]|uniref:Uncharacterized protein n=1 Tax=Streptomyces spinoverrucosus TaxID=284043 RepID=A0A4Y3VS20_9ACTN|nr:hypothetical protein [Streptomyces spinoverrucosus]GEC09433.1 hypothetical protein SSP24_70880 [Streptomyces spinoverrucosus]GHB86628.1 hypothetical protein GCM10010397_67970 [Streptomyces spinoverrucosus]